MLALVNVGWDLETGLTMSESVRNLKVQHRWKDDASWYSQQGTQLKQNHNQMSQSNKTSRALLSDLGFGNKYILSRMTKTV